MESFKNKVVWIVGSSSGIGKALALDMAKMEANLILSSRNTKELNRIKEECLKFTQKCAVIPLDLESNENYINQVDEIVTNFERIDYLLLVGGVSQRSLVSETPLTIDRKLMEINYFGIVALAKAALPVMIRQTYGHIVVVSSIAGKFGWPQRSAYSASKHALHGFFETLRAEQMENNINVTIALPGRVKTNISKNALKKDGSNYGNLDKGQENGISAQSCSKQIIKGILNNKKEILIGGKEIYMVWIRKYFPSLYYRLAAKMEPNR